MFPCKLLVQVLFAILVIFTVQGYASPIPFHPRDESSEVSPSGPHISSVDPPFLPWHGPREDSRPEAPVNVVTSPKAREEKKDNESITLASNAHSENRSFLDTHLALVIILSILVPLVLCMALYPVVRHYRNRKNALQVADENTSTENANQSFKEKDPDTSCSEESNQSDLETLPAGLVYIPPVPQNGTQPLFGLFLSPCGQVLGVKDTWKLAGSGDGKNISKENILVHEV